MYFAILGKNRELSLKELEFASPTNLRPAQNQKIVLFDTAEASKLTQIAGIIKRGKIVESDLDQLFSANPDKRILGVADKNQGINLKKQYNLKRFKQVDLLHTDLDVKKKGIELIRIGNQRGQVLGYQNIKLYEIVDFEKPGRSMQMGMMPAKLTHTMLNIALSYQQNADKADKTDKKEQTLIYDPFTGSGTTGFLANYFGYDFLGSDLKLTFAEKNKPRWLASKYAHKDQTFDFFLQDATKPLENPKLFTQTPVIVTEGWLGPIIKQSTTPEQVKEYQRRVKNVYVQRVEQMASAFTQKPVMVFTIPVYLGHENFIESSIISSIHQRGFDMHTIDELYKRDQHKVARKIIILTPKKEKNLI